MTNHIFYNDVNLEKIQVLSEHKKWLDQWLERLLASIEDGEVAASQCLQGVLIELLLNKSMKVDWLGVFNNLLMTNEGLPMAYSLAYGKKLHKFDAQYEQVTVHSIHTFWYINKLIDSKFSDSKLTKVLSEFWQPSGWYYNPQVSITTERYRMRVELFMSLAMATEILLDTEENEAFKTKIEAHIMTEPQTNYLSAEYFRLVSLNKINKTQYITTIATKLQELLLACSLERGFSDFDVKSKVDDYMGTAKRVGRDAALVSAISTLHAKQISESLGGNSEIDGIVESFNKSHKSNPFSFAAFKMRDLDPDFGPSITPHEIIATNILSNLSTY